MGDERCATCRFYRAGYHTLDSRGHPTAKLWPWWIFTTSNTSTARRGFCCRRSPEAEYGTPTVNDADWGAEWEADGEATPVMMGVVTGAGPRNRGDIQFDLVMPCVGDRIEIRVVE